MPTCNLYVGIDVAVPLVNARGTASWALAIPNEIGLLGGVFYQQGFVLDPGANALGATVTNAGQATVGIR